VKEHFDITQQISSQSNNLLKLQQFCADFIAKSSEKIFNSLYFTSLPDKDVSRNCNIKTQCCM
jgi:hypothetical protein